MPGPQSARFGASFEGKCKEQGGDRRVIGDVSVMKGSVFNGRFVLSNHVVSANTSGEVQFR